MSTLHLSYNCLGFELHDNDRFIALYRATEELPRTDAPKPCFAPIYTPSGKLITEYRPADHTWHTGLYYGWVHVNDANLWGGGWYIPESGRYEDVENSHGVQRHDAFSDTVTDGQDVSLTEALTWLDAADQPMVSETRQFRFQTLENTSGYLWMIDSTITPVVDKVTLGASRAAKYSGLWIRTGPPFSDAHHRSSEGLEGHEQIMGAHARWVSAAGSAGGMVVMMDHPDNPRHPTTWFTRRNILSAGLLMTGDLDIQKPESLHLKYGFVILDTPADTETIETLYSHYLDQT